MTVSVGVGVLREDGHDHEALIGAAEEAMFAAASSGVAVIPGGLTEAAQQRGPDPRDQP